MSPLILHKHENGCVGGNSLDYNAMGKRETYITELTTYLVWFQQGRLGHQEHSASTLESTVKEKMKQQSYSSNNVKHTS